VFKEKLELVNLESESARSLPFSAFQDCKLFLYDIMIKDAEVELRDIIREHQLLLNTTDMRLPHEWYPYARLMKRKIIFHGGPTNSGKTYQALQRLKNADPEKG
jgi:ATP-dependent RNA helicase SUPV3L1/SUV3